MTTPTTASQTTEVTAADATATRDGAEPALDNRADPPRRAWRPRLPSRLALASIRTRILVGFVATMAAAIVASVIVTDEVLKARLYERIDDDLAQEADELRRIAAGNDPATGRPFGQNARRIFRVYFEQNSPSTGEVVLTFIEGAPFLRSRSTTTSFELSAESPLAARWTSLEESERDSIDTPEGPADYLVLPVKGEAGVLGTFVVIQFADVLQRPYDDALVATGVVGLAMLLIGALLAWHMAGGILRPVSSLTRTARAISETDLTQRIAVSGHDEVADLAATLNAMLDRLEHALSSQRRFLDDAGHELRTPITIVRGHLELLEDDPEERRATVALVLDEVDRMSRMVDDLILLSKAERPDFLQPETVELAPFTDELLFKAGALGDREWLSAATGDGVVVIDRQRLTQAVMQLAQNAVEHTEEGSRIWLGSAHDGRDARFWVRDEGPGIAPQDQERIFERFERSGARRSGTGSGSGLGLSIVRAIAEAHGGRVELRSDLGDGAAFTLVVPVDGPCRPRKEET